MSEPLTYNVEQAAERLGGPFTVDWLRKHLAQIPHLRSGAGRGKAGRVGFTEAHLAAIITAHTVEPQPQAVRDGIAGSVRTRRGAA